MNRDVFRLAILGSRGGYGRPIGIIVGIAVGVSLLLTLLGAANGLQARDKRTAWLNTYYDGMTEISSLEANQALLLSADDYFRDEAIIRRDVAIGLGSTMRFPWGDVPSPGTYLASPAMQHLIDSNPPKQLGDRYGNFAGILPDSALASPDSLVIVVGQSEADMLAIGIAAVVNDLSGEANSQNDVYRTIIIIGGIAMFFPILLFVGIVTHLGAAQRSERLSTLRMIGAGPGLVARLAAAEMALLGLIGALLGIGLWVAGKPIASRFSIDQGRFFTDDLGLSPITVLLVSFGAVLGATLVSVWQIKRAGIGPLGVTRQQMEHTPTPLRIIPLVLGLLAMTYATRSYLNSGDRDIAGLLVIFGFTATAFGIILIGPLLTSAVCRIASRRVSSAAGTIAASSIKRHPVRTFRSVSGLVLAVFVASVFAGSASSVLDERETPEAEGALPLSALVAYLNDPTITDPVDLSTLDRTVANLTAIPGVTVATVGWYEAQDWEFTVFPTGEAQAVGLPVSDGSDFTGVNLSNAIYVYETDSLTDAVSFTSIDGFVPGVVLVQTNGDPAAIEQARTTLMTSGITTGANSRSDLADRDSRKFVNSMSNLAYIGIAITILIAGISLSVSTASSVIERKRIFGLLRLTGMPRSTLRNVVVVEALLPLLAVVGISIGFGFFVAWLIVDGLSVERTISWPDSRYVLTIVSSTVLAALSVLATVRIANSMTGVTSTRFE